MYICSSKPKLPFLARGSGRVTQSKKQKADIPPFTLPDLPDHSRPLPEGVWKTSKLSIIRLLLIHIYIFQTYLYIIL